jgi:acyl-phosphate glycerol 3-phosphate acyltransferase
MNTFDVTGSKPLALAVLLLDMAKGALAVWLASALSPGGFWPGACAGVGAVAGHSFSVWLKFKGGRGLATCAGVMFVLAWGGVAVWGCIWGLHYAVSRNLHGANIVASVLSAPALFLLPPALTQSMLHHGESLAALVIAFAVMCVLILIRHRGYYRQLLHASTTS